MDYHKEKNRRLVESVEVTEKGIYLIRLKKIFDASTLEEFDKVLAYLIQKERYRIVVDYGHVEFVSSAGWGALVAELQRVRDEGGDIRVAAMPPDVHDVFLLLELDNFVDGYYTVDDAIRSYETDDYYAELNPAVEEPAEPQPDQAEEASGDVSVTAGDEDSHDENDEVTELEDDSPAELSAADQIEPDTDFDDTLPDESEEPAEEALVDAELLSTTAGEASEDDDDYYDEEAAADLDQSAEFAAAEPIYEDDVEEAPVETADGIEVGYDEPADTQAEYSSIEGESEDNEEYLIDEVASPPQDDDDNELLADDEREESEELEYEDVYLQPISEREGQEELQSFKSENYFSDNLEMLTTDDGQVLEYQEYANQSLSKEADPRYAEYFSPSPHERDFRNERESFEDLKEEQERTGRVSNEGETGLLGNDDAGRSDGESDEQNEDWQEDDFSPFELHDINDPWLLDDIDTLPEEDEYEDAEIDQKAAFYSQFLEMPEPDHDSQSSNNEEEKPDTPSLLSSGNSSEEDDKAPADDSLARYFLQEQPDDAQPEDECSPALSSPERASESPETSHGDQSQHDNPDEARLVLLQLIRENPSHGPEMLRKALEQATDPPVKMSRSTIYRWLRDEGLSTKKQRLDYAGSQ